MSETKCPPPHLVTLAIAIAAIARLTQGQDVVGYLPVQPEQVHLSLGADESQMIVTWTTLTPTGQAYAEYGSDSQLTDKVIAFGTSEVFTDGGSKRKKRFIHRVVMDKLTSNTTYFYRVGHTEGLLYPPKKTFHFKTFPSGSDWSPNLIVFGDLGYENAQAVPRITQEVESASIDAVLHVGDLAYDLHDSNGDVGDSYMRHIEKITAYCPYQVAVGNHEESYNFSHYDARFTMIDQRSKVKNNHFYSFDIGPIHFVVFSTEYYCYLQYGWRQISNQFNWLKGDLEWANRPENRAQRPWIITLAHKPLYCDEIRCKFDASIIRNGYPFFRKYGIEDLLHKYGVDVQFYGHEHKYQRLWPVYKNTVLNGSTEEPYTDPGASVHIITGSAGCKERLSPSIFSTRSQWRAATIYDYGYTRLRAINSSHLHLQQVSDDDDGHIVDEVMIIKSNHGPFEKRVPLRY